MKFLTIKKNLNSGKCIERLEGLADDADDADLLSLRFATNLTGIYNPAVKPPRHPPLRLTPLQGRGIFPLVLLSPLPLEDPISSSNKNKPGIYTLEGLADDAEDADLLSLRAAAPLTGIYKTGVQPPRHPPLRLTPFQGRGIFPLLLLSPLPLEDPISSSNKNKPGIYTLEGLDDDAEDADLLSLRAAAPLTGIYKTGVQPPRHPPLRLIPLQGRGIFPLLLLSPLPLDHPMSSLNKNKPGIYTLEGLADDAEDADLLSLRAAAPLTGIYKTGVQPPRHPPLRLTPLQGRGIFPLLFVNPLPLERAISSLNKNKPGIYTLEGLADDAEDADLLSLRAAAPLTGIYKTVVQPPRHPPLRLTPLQGRGIFPLLFVNPLPLEGPISSLNKNKPGIYTLEGLADDAEDADLLSLRAAAPLTGIYKPGGKPPRHPPLRLTPLQGRGIFPLLFVNPLPLVRPISSLNKNLKS